MPELTKQSVIKLLNLVDTGIPGKRDYSKLENIGNRDKELNSELAFNEFWDYCLKKRVPLRQINDDSLAFSPLNDSSKYCCELVGRALEVQKERYSGLFKANNFEKLIDFNRLYYNANACDQVKCSLGERDLNEILAKFNAISLVKNLTVDADEQRAADFFHDFGLKIQGMKNVDVGKLGTGRQLSVEITEEVNRSSCKRKIHLVDANKKSQYIEIPSVFDKISSEDLSRFLNIEVSHRFFQPQKNILENSVKSIFNWTVLNKLIDWLVNILKSSSTSQAPNVTEKTSDFRERLQKIPEEIELVSGKDNSTSCSSTSKVSR